MVAMHGAKAPGQGVGQQGRRGEGGYQGIAFCRLSRVHVLPHSYRDWSASLGVVKVLALSVPHARPGVATALQAFNAAHEQLVNPRLKEKVRLHGTEAFVEAGGRRETKH